jgi:glucose-1-phosphate thymidylyltransferase
MKGILLAGGSGSRLYPLTKTTSKQLLAVYDKPMIYYPLSSLMRYGIRKVLIISTPQDTPNIRQLFGDGGSLGLDISYAVQERPEGIAQAFLLGEDFIGGEDVCLILGDNIFYMDEQPIPAAAEKRMEHATIFGYYVPDPHRFGVIEFDRNFNVVSIEEKPAAPKSSIVSVGLYFYPGDVATKAKSLRPSARNELEITDLNNLYVAEGRLKAVLLRQGAVWFDAGTYGSLMEAAHFVQIMESRQGLQIGCIEEIAYRGGFISKENLSALLENMGDGAYKEYLRRVCGGGNDIC